VTEQGGSEGGKQHCQLFMNQKKRKGVRVVLNGSLARKWGENRKKLPGCHGRPGEPKGQGERGEGTCGLA